MTGSPVDIVVERVPMPAWVSRIDPTEREVLDDVFGEQLEWSFATPWVYRALASPMTHEPILKAPTATEPGSPFAYWSALLNMLIYSFGWARPDRGMRWWYDAGKPVDDARLQLMSQVWDADGQLDWFAGWLWTTEAIFQSELLADLTGYCDDGAREPIDERWLETARGAAASAGFPAPIGHGGWDELHLSAHSSGPLRDTAGDERLLRSAKTERTATLVSHSMTGWYRALAAHGAELPDIGDRSWRVDVVVRPVGHLGTFRRSRASGLWFSGPHRLHVRGV